MIIVKGHARMPPEEIERLRPGLTRFIEETRRQDGCLSYHYAIDLLEPGLLQVSEVWRDLAAKEAHMEDIGTLLIALEGATVEELAVDAYEATYVETVLGEPAPEAIQAGVTVRPIERPK